MADWAWVTLAMMGSLFAAAFFTSATESQLIDEVRAVYRERLVDAVLMEQAADSIIYYKEKLLKLQISSVNEQKKSESLPSLPLMRSWETYQEKKSRLFLKK